MKRIAILSGAVVVVEFIGLVGGCGAYRGGMSDSSLSSTVAEKAAEVAASVGGVDGFGGTMMAGFIDHMPARMGFSANNDLAAEDATQLILIRNESLEEATFHLTYFASYDGLEEQSQDVVVGAGQSVEVEIPCAEIIGMGPLGVPGATGCHLASGFEVENTMSVPLFLGTDFFCQDVREFVLTADEFDFDDDEDVEELILLSDGFVGHMQFGGPFGHSHRPGAMGRHMMMGDFDSWDEWYDELDEDGSGMMGGAGGMMGSR